MSDDEKIGPKKMFVLHVAIPDFWGDDLEENAAALLEEGEAPTAEDRLMVVTEEWMRSEVGITLVSLPTEMDEPEVHSYVGTIVGAETRRRALSGEEAE